jgi:malonate-semialdehyde dehydrogenase (acetylating)/methylmalonate-semialdehyde dehydrogenase
MPDADMDMATNAIMGAAYGAAGERCMALSVVLAVGDKAADDLCARLEKQIAVLRVGPGLDQTPENEMGPLISSVHRSAGLYRQRRITGANLRVDGRGFSVKGHEKGYFVGPTLFDNVTPEMTIYKEEIFGPVLSVVRVADYNSAVELINRHEYGNGTAIFTRDGGCARRFCEEAGRYGGVNVPIPVPMAFHSFGGWKRSIFGALNVHGNDGVRFYTRMKTVTARWPEMQQDTGAAFSMPTLG